jgi:tetratricopeptide (TPR) repeat protein
VAADLLRLCAFLHPDAIPEELFGQGAVHLGPVLAAFASNPLAFNTACATVSAYSLLRRNSTEKTLSFHRLVQAVLQDTMTEQERTLWIERVVMALDAVFPDSESTTWSQCERLVPHVLICATCTQSWMSTNTDLASLLFKTALYLVDRAQYDQAEPLYQRALRIREQAYGSDHHLVAWSLNRLAILYRKQCKYDQAEPLYQRALRIREQAHGPDHPDVAHPLNGLADLYRKQGKYDQAELLYHHALHILEQTHGPDHPLVAYSLIGLANLYCEQGKYDQAEPLFQRTVVIREHHLGPQHLEMAEILHDFAAFHYAQGKNIHEAVSLYQRALVIREQSLGPHHPKTMDTRKRYVTLLRALGRHDEAALVEVSQPEQIKTEEERKEH